MAAMFPMTAFGGRYDWFWAWNTLDPVEAKRLSEPDAIKQRDAMGSKRDLRAVKVDVIPASWGFPDRCLVRWEMVRG